MEISRPNNDYASRDSDYERNSVCESFTEPALQKYKKVSTRTILVEILLILISVFKILLACLAILFKKNEIILDRWLKIAIFFDFFEIIHATFLIHYVRDHLDNYFNFLKIPQQNINREVCSLDIIFEANYSIMHIKWLNIVNKIFYIIIFSWGNYIFFSNNGMEKYQENDSYLILFSLLLIPGYMVIVFFIVFVLLTMLSFFILGVIKCLKKMRKFMKKYWKRKEKKKLMKCLIPIKAEDIANFSSLICSICLNNFDTVKKVIQLPCNEQHLFHYKCLKKWIFTNASCPICRVKLE